MHLDFNKTYHLENDRVLLRPLAASDKGLLMEYAVNEPETWKYNAPGGGGREKFETYFSHAMAQFEQGKEYPFIVFDKQLQKWAGATRFYDISNVFSRLDLGYTWYGKAFRGTGLNKNCKYLLLELAFDQLDARRVGFSANAKNERSINAMKSIGCTVEGVLREYGRDAEGNVIDSIRLSILKSEWEGWARAKLLSKCQRATV